MREKLNNIIHSRVFIVILMLVFICVTLLVGTYAWFTWNSSDNTKLVMSIGRVADVVFTNGNDIKSDLTPVFNYTDGLSTTFTINNRDTSGAIIGYNVYLNITTIADELVSKDVKWTLIKDNEVIKDGDLSTASNGVSITLYNGALSTGITSYTLYLYIDGNVENDPNMMGKTINGSIMVEASDSGVNLLNNITSLYTGGNPTLITQPTSNNKYYYSYQDTGKTWGLMNDGLKIDNTLDATTTGLATTVTDTTALTSGTEGNIRYFGPSDKVNNYIYFNCSDYDNQSDATCEKWRIIGIVDGKVKILSDSIGNIAWDNDSINWDTATLKSMLNEGGTYYTSLHTKNPETLKLISESTWYLGGYSIVSDVYPNDMYNYERTNKEGTTIYSGNPFTVEENIGLMYASDYGYGTNLTKCSEAIMKSYSDEYSSECRANNWLFNAYQWLITPIKSYSWAMGAVSSDGSVYDEAYDSSLFVRPVLYLDTDVMINNGNGSSDNPYQITIKKPTTLIDHITSLYTNGKPTLITQQTSNDTYYYSYQDSTKTWGLMNDGLKVAASSGTGATTITNINALTSGTEGNIRYFGPRDKVNNYIYFNCSDYSNQSSSTCEKWRIIGIVDGKVKLIRDYSIGNLAWDQDKNQDSTKTTYNNNWTTSSLQEFLNGLYYNRGTKDKHTYYSGSSGTTINTLYLSDIGITEATRNKNLISESTWYLGEYSTSSGLYPNDIYNYERTNKVGTTIYSTNDFTINKNIGLMYPSDYGYGTDLTKCGKDIYGYEFVSACNTNNWLFNSASQWLITPRSSDSLYAGRVDSGGKAGYYYVYSTLCGVRPVLYLNTNVAIGSGDGSSGSPYQLYV